MSALLLPLTYDVGSPTAASYNYDSPTALTTTSANAGAAALRTYDKPAQVLQLAIAAIPARLAAEGGEAILGGSRVIGEHAATRMAGRGVTRDMVENTIRSGNPYWDPRNRVINYIQSGAGPGGHDVLVGVNPISGKVTTVIEGRGLVRGRMVPLK